MIKIMTEDKKVKRKTKIINKKKTIIINPKKEKKENIMKKLMEKIMIITVLLKVKEIPQDSQILEVNMIWI